MPSNFFKNRRVYLLTSVAYMGYDTGVMGSVLALRAFKKDFGLPTDSSGFASSKNAYVSSNVVSLLTAGCFFGAISAVFINERFGRRHSPMFFSVIFLIGAAIQTGEHHEIGMIYGGRVIAGLGIGGMSSITPVFVSENCPPHVRGRIAGLSQEFLVIGCTFAYWLDYVVSLHIPQGRYSEAAQSPSHVRCEPEGHPDVIKELAEIRTAIEEELNATEGVTWRECLLPGNRYRFVTGFCLMFWQQFSGTSSIGYYTPQIFQMVGVSKSSSSLFATGVYGTVKVVTTGLFLIIRIDQFARKKSLMAELCRTAFTKRKTYTTLRSKFSAVLFRGSIYKTRPLYDSLRQSLGDARIFGGAGKKSHFYDIKVAVTSTDELAKNAIIMANYNRQGENYARHIFQRPSDPSKEPMIWEAAAASAAAPPYFTAFWHPETSRT
ncbi:MFS general substrate transporter [Lindgomyces ingoldianus]|uniref:MFS general substrate transporter n=1 Tax=Lindgomyces ingoldianus TaxID=673940 RepID=A0ACB6QUE9_9PLEO|nr:MFS general substrate transporter [Lindgomyces ingoldianus]KAF2470520.1 MFS general substrate transporter [Lindgomyces ingoldianus]